MRRLLFYENQRDPAMAQLPTLSINGRPYYSDMRLREFRAVDNPHHRIAYDDVDAHPDRYAFGNGLAVPHQVSYLRKPSGAMLIAISPAIDGRPFFRDLPFLVRALARLNHHLAPDRSARKLAAATSPIMRDAVFNDILYKSALEVALDPEHPAHRKYVVDVSDDVDEFHPVSSAKVPDMLRKAAHIIPGRPAHTLTRTIVYGRKADGSMSVTVTSDRVGKQSFNAFPLAVRVQARACLFLTGTFEEYEKIRAATALPHNHQLAVWDDILCRRADAIQSRMKQRDDAKTVENRVLYGPHTEHQVGRELPVEDDVASTDGR